MLQRIADDYIAKLNHTDAILFNQIVLAHQNDTVDELNQTIRTTLKDNQKINSKELTYTVQRKIPNELGNEVDIIQTQKPFAVGDKVLFRCNDTTLDVMNGEFGLIKAIEPNKMTVEFKDKRVISFEPTKYKDFDYGYATTVHKAQGLTVNHTHVYFTGQQWDRHLAYVALTRHRQSVHLYVDKPSFISHQKFISQLSRRAVSDNVLDWPLNFAKHRGFDTENLFTRLLHRLGEWTKNIKSSWELKIAIDSKAITTENTYNKKPTEIIKPFHFNWLSTDYHTEWNKLKPLNNDTVKLMAQLMNICKKESSE